ncbi:MAG: cupin domain-containing protein [Gammaproteobacteria bacterium]|nr:cupin domain-containing protein [Gammaproteobacteria bacterium]
MLPPLQLDRADFLAHYWQRRALFLPGAVNPHCIELSPAELAGLAMEQDVESRIVASREGNWTQQHGPFEAADLQRSGSWTLLVQAVDHYLADVAQLRDLIDFIPQWRMDDIMVSYSTDGASVGPHYDHYDVFLLQGDGQKRWQVGQHCTAREPLQDNQALRLLQNFHCEAEYLLGPGDMLYVPPGVAHWGVAVGESMTFSIGFRAPRLADMAARWLDDKLANAEPDIFFTDAGRSAQGRPGEICAADITRAHQQLRRALDDTTSPDTWFGELVTEPRYELLPTQQDIDAFATALAGPGYTLYRVPGSKLAWYAMQDGIMAFSNGQALRVDAGSQGLLEALCTCEQLDAATPAPAESGALIEFLIASGSVYVE